MFDRVAGVLWRSKGLVSRSEWTARLLGAPPSRLTTERGLLIVQIDGLSRRVLAGALERGTMPNVAGLLEDEGYQLRGVYSGLPSSTPAAQAELFYGVPLVVPAFAYVDREGGRVMRMSNPDAAADVERGLAGHQPLLDGGSSYCNLFRGGAAEARFCISSLTWTDPFRTRHPLALPAVVLLYGGELLQAAALVLREVLVTPARLAAAVGRGQDLKSELKFAGSRVAVAVALRELVALSAMVDVARGLPVIHLNLLGYDETAHRRGPGSPFTRRSLHDIDGVIGRLLVAARRSRRRSYELWLLSDHGQEPTVPYIEERGRSVHDVVADAFAAHGVHSEHVPEVLHGGKRPARAVVRDRVARLVTHGGGDQAERWHRGRLAVTAQGPLGHVYAPRPLTDTEKAEIAHTLVERGRVPLVLAADGPGRARAWTAGAAWQLPEDGRGLLGPDHPYLDATADDLVGLCHHRDAGDLLLSGWAPGRPPVSFPHENGSHAGPGPGETDAFVMTPADVRFPLRGAAPIRAADIRTAAMSMLNGTGDSGNEEVPRPARAEAPVAPGTLRLLTYNVHSCVGLDGVLSVERVAQVIASHDPDVVALQELDVGRGRTGGVDQAQEIADRLEMLLHFHPTLSVGEERYGDAVLSRLPMRVVRAAPLPRVRFLEPRGAIWVEIETHGTTLQIVNTHLSLHPLERGLQVSALLGREWLGAIPPGQAVLCGDFNAFAWFPSCRRIVRRLDDAQVGQPGYRPRATFQLPLGVGRIDHVFVDPAIAITRVSVADDGLARVASDHLPLVVDLRVGRQAARQGGAP